MVEQLRNASGFGWEDASKRVVATDAVWDTYIKAHKKAAQWRHTPFPLYDETQYLVKGVVATGAGAFHAGETPTPSSPFFTSDLGLGDDEINISGAVDDGTWAENHAVTGAAASSPAAFIPEDKPLREMISFQVRNTATIERHRINSDIFFLSAEDFFHSDACTCRF